MRTACPGVSHCRLRCLQQRRFLAPTFLPPLPPSTLRRVPPYIEQNKEVVYGLHSHALPGQKSDQCSVKSTAQTLILLRFACFCVSVERPRVPVDLSTSVCGHMCARNALLACACSSDGLVSPDDKKNRRRKTRNWGGRDVGAVEPKDCPTGAQSCVERETLSKTLEYASSRRHTAPDTPFPSLHQSNTVLRQILVEDEARTLRAQAPSVAQVDTLTCT